MPMWQPVIIIPNCITQYLRNLLESDYAALKKVLSGTDYETALKETR